jgi:hypothetical protein
LHWWHDKIKSCALTTIAQELTHLIGIPSDNNGNSRTASGVQKRVRGQIKSDLDWPVSNWMSLTAGNTITIPSDINRFNKQRSLSTFKSKNNKFETRKVVRPA